jgi:hypothetical protein
MEPKFSHDSIKLILKMYMKHRLHVDISNDINGHLQALLTVMDLMIPTYDYVGPITGKNIGIEDETND